MMHTRILMRAALVIFTLGAALLTAACQPRAAQEPAISSAWAAATPPGATVGAAYMEIAGGAADTLLGATTPVAAKVEMHENSEDGGMMRMRQLQSVELQPGRAFVFQPGGAHLMLVGLQAPLAADTRFPLTLRFKNAGDVVVDVAVMAPGAAQQH